MENNISEAPTEFDDLIEKMNLLPKDWEKFLKESRVFIDRLELKLRSEMQKQEIVFLPCSKFSELCSNDVLIFSERFRRLAPKLIERMDLNLETDGLLNSQFQIKVLYEQNLALRNIINIFQQFKGFNNPTQTFMLNKPLQTIGFHPDTTLNLIGFRVIEILKKHSIPIERVGVCPVCDDIFWVKRIEKTPNFTPYCSDPCGNTFNARKTRIRKSEKELAKQLEKLKKQKAKLSPEHPLVLEQVEKVNKLFQKIKRKKQEYVII